jgi:23S rRNA (adenine-N6)-dimethyltransferase
VPERAPNWGWHQLDSRWAQRLVRDAEIEPGDLVVDIGAGSGAITRPLVDAGAKVVAVELHPRRAALLRARFAGDAVVVVHADASDLRLPRRPFKVVCNPPFAITAAILRRITHPASRLEHGSIVLPAWAATRWATGRGLGGMASKRTFQIERGLRLPRNAFRPNAPADAFVLVIDRTSAGWLR